MKKKIPPEGRKEELAMTKFWMVTLTILALSATGCPDGDDDCMSDPSLCDPDSDTDSDTGADADADSDATDDGTTDDGDTSEVANCPSVAGNWALTFRNTETGAVDNLLLTLEQDGCLVIGVDDVSCEWSGTISESGYLSVYVDCYTTDRTVTGNFQTPPHMDGDWRTTDALASGTWTADPQ